MNYDFNVNLDIPYPNIDNVKPNKILAYKLKEAYAGNISELSCILKYIFQNIYLEEKYNSIKKVIKDIAIVEMHHLNIIGTMINKLGLKPIYTSVNRFGNETYWTSNIINYETDLYKLLIDNINGEESTINLYEDIIRNSKDLNVINMLKRIILDEENHIKIFKFILDNIFYEKRTL